jgi:hypothetical protein
MKTLNLSIIVLLTCCQSLVIFSQKNTVVNYFPQQPKMILKLNMASLGQKMKWEEFTKTKLFEEVTKDATEEGKTFLKNPASAGIDMSQGIFVVVPATSENKKTQPIVYSVPRDTGQLVAMIKKLAPTGIRVKIPNGKMIVYKQTAIAWNKDIVIMTEDDIKATSVNAGEKSNAPDEAPKTKRLAERCKLLLTKQKAAFTNEHFTSLLKEDGDIYVWINNMQPRSQKTKAPQIVEMLNKNMLSGATYSAGVIRFENGRTTMQMKRYVTASIDSLYRKYPTKNINRELTGKLPGGQPIFVYALRFSPAMLNEILMRAGADRYVDSLSKKNIKMDDIVSALRGDIAMAVIKVNDGGDEDSITKAMSGIQVFLAGGMQDKQKFEALSSALQTQKDTSKNQSSKKMKPFIFSNDSLFVVSLSQRAAQKFLQSSGTNGEMKNFFAQYQNYPNASRIDLKTILGFAMQGAAKKRSEEEVRQMSEALGTFDTLISYGGIYSEGSLSSTMQLILTNKDENSLKQFIDLFDLFYLMGHKKSSASTGSSQQGSVQ